MCVQTKGGESQPRTLENSDVENAPASAPTLLEPATKGRVTNVAVTSVPKTTKTTKTGDEGRVLRGLELYRTKGGKIERRPSGGYSVPSRTSERTYRVSLHEPARCGCEDHRRTRRTCLHIIAATIFEAKTRAS